MVDNTGTVNGGLGNDNISMGAAGDASYIFFDGSDGADAVLEFTGGEDFIALEEADTTDGTDGAAAVMVDGSAADNIAGAAFDEFAEDGDTAAADVFFALVATLANSNASDLYDDYTNKNAEALLEAMTSAIDDGGLASGITVDNAGDKFFVIAYEDDGADVGAHLYWVNSAAVVSDTIATLNEIFYVAFFDAVADDALDNGELVMRSITDDVATFG